MERMSLAEKQIFDYLKTIGCCSVCSLRFCGISFTEKNLLLDDILSEVNLLDTSQSSTTACIICLGLLQESNLTLFVEELKNQLKNSNYDSEEIYFSLNIPTAIQIREHAVRIHLSESKTDLSSSTVTKFRIQNIKDVWKFLASRKMLLDTTINIKFSPNATSFSAEVFTSYTHDQDECGQLMKNYSLLSKCLNNKPLVKDKVITKNTIVNTIELITDQDFSQYFTVPPEIPKHFVKIVNLQFKHESIFIGGRYIKLSRRLSQTPWFIQGQSKMKTSVQEIICHFIAKYTKAESVKFLSSGREDVDVRMISDGRPFAVEIVNPKKAKLVENDLLIMYNEINKNKEMVRICGYLKLISKMDLKQLKQGENSKSKSYRALCICKKHDQILSTIEKLSTVRNLKIIQNTPVRVLHRRTVFPRERTIFQIRSRLANQQEINQYHSVGKYLLNNCIYFILDIKTQAGTYVKEFVHGDFGRTFPNLCHMLQTDVDIVALDVTNISLEWP